MDSYEAISLIGALRQIAERLESIEYAIESLTGSIDILTETYTNAQNKDNDN